MGRFALEASPPPPPPVAFDFEDDDDGDDEDASNDDDGDASSTDEMSTRHFTLYHSWQKGGVVLDMRIVILVGGGLV